VDGKTGLSAFKISYLRIRMAHCCDTKNEFRPRYDVHGEKKKVELFF
jgi:hypothetical protein